MSDATPAWPAPSGLPTPPQSPPVAPGETEVEPPAVAAAKVAVLEQRYAEAVGLLEDFLTQHPEDVRAWHRLAGARIGLDQHESALTAAERSIELDPACAPAHLMRGIALLHFKRWSEVEQAANRSLELNPAKADTHALLAMALAGQGRNKAALDAAHAALAIDPAQPAAARLVLQHSSRISRWAPLISAAAIPAAVVLVILAFALSGADSTPLFGWFAAGAFAVAVIGIYRMAADRDVPVRMTPPASALVVVTVLAIAYVAIPLVLAGTGRDGMVVVLLANAFFTTSATLGLSRRTRRRRSSSPAYTPAPDSPYAPPQLRG